MAVYFKGSAQTVFMTQPQQKPPSSQPANHAVIELKALRSELALVKEELTGLRTDFKNRKPPDIVDQVAKGVVLAGVFWTVVWFVLAALFHVI